MTSVTPSTVLLQLLEAHDADTLQHSLRVRHYALAMADVLGLALYQRHQLKIAAELHDLGKVGVPLDILHKDRALTASERQVIETHPVVGEQMLAEAIEDSVVLAAVRHHHERFDGRGYPDGLFGKRIPLLARILSIADCFDALTTHRPYRRPMTRPDVMLTLGREAGKQFDPELFLAFREVPGMRPRPIRRPHGSGRSLRQTMAAATR